VEVIEHLDQELPSVVGDSHQLQQVFLNILNNAYDAVGEIGRAARIEIATTRNGNSVEISFRDNGPGISHLIASSIRSSLPRKWGRGRAWD